MKQERAERVGEAMRTELADLLETSVKDPRVGFVSLTRVEVSRDLAQAKVYVSVLDAAHEVESLAGLRSAARFLRGEVARRVQLRVAPQLVFLIDRGIQQSMAVQALLKEAGAVPPPRDPGDE
ncbi:MAG: 30S ribosome-binding factor RbfA [Thermaerobacter sp.]|nr:30S ribosome-binding factor RbfA [Thermaerobacter sp.]